MSRKVFQLVVMDSHRNHFYFFDNREDVETKYLEQAISLTGEPYGSFDEALDNFDWDCNLRERMVILEFPLDDVIEVVA